MEALGAREVRLKSYGTCYLHLRRPAITVGEEPHLHAHGIRMDANEDLNLNR